MFECVNGTKGEEAALAAADADWSACEARIAAAFESLKQREVLALGQAGQTQYDALSEVERSFHDAALAGAGVQFLGACFYTREDGQRARSTGELPIALWAPQGDFDQSMRAIGRAVVEEFARVGLRITWDGRSRSRPVVRLH